MRDKVLKNGSTAYYWDLPTWARNAKDPKCPLVNADLGTHYGPAKEKADKYNALLDAWRTQNEDPGEGAQDRIAAVGTIDWIIAQFQNSDEYKEEIEASTRANYDAGLRLIAEYIRPVSRKRFGETHQSEILPHHVDKLFKKLKEGGHGGRVTTASHAIRAMKRAWNVAHHYNARVVPEANPFRKIRGLGSTGRETHHAEHSHLQAFVDKANELGHPSVALAALVTFHWFQREIDIIRRMAWSDYEAGARVKVRHYKNRNKKKGERENIVWLALTDPATGEALFPEIEAQIAKTPVRGPLMVMRDKPDSRRKKPQPYQAYTVDYFGKLCREVLDAAGLRAPMTFASFRHGGFTESGDAQATDQEFIAGGGHRTRGILSTYVKKTNPQAINLARKRLELRRTQKRRLSE